MSSLLMYWTIIMFLVQILLMFLLLLLALDVYIRIGKLYKVIVVHMPSCLLSDLINYYDVYMIQHQRCL